MFLSVFNSERMVRIEFKVGGLNFNVMEEIVCLRCHSDKVAKKGTRESRILGKVQRYGCKNCKYRFSIYENLWNEGRYKKQTINDGENNEKFVFKLTPKERIKKIKLPQKMTKDLAYFCGFLAGDGSIGYRKNKKEYWIAGVGNPSDEVEYYDILIKSLIKKLFGFNVKTKLYGKGYGFSLNSKTLVKYLTEFIGLPLGKKYDSLTIPKIILKDKEFVRNFISGLADTDFHLAIKKRNYPVIIGVSKSRPFIEEIKDFLNKEGYKVGIYERKQFDKRTNKIYVTYSVEISGYKHLKKWISEIGFRHPKNIKKLNFLREKGKL